MQVTTQAKGGVEGLAFLKKIHCALLTHHNFLNAAILRSSLGQDREERKGVWTKVAILSIWLFLMWGGGVETTGRV